MATKRKAKKKMGEADSRKAPTLYYVDGYHGGIKGHMPLGAWRDIFSVMKKFPKWKLCIDLEPISWTPLRRRDPEVYEELKEYLKDRRARARVEMVAASYAQPFSWVIGGESNIRHLTRGKEILEEHFPGIVVDTYAVQEPCWTSCMPQALLSAGYVRAVLKDPSTAWSGYSVGRDADVLHWVGPEGSAIPCVPRYACEELVKCWETESSYGTAEFSRKCVAHGIAHPTGMYFQDCGWSAKPRVDFDHVQWVTWREYFEKIAPKPDREWHFTQEDIRATLPWGGRVIQRLARQVRSAENRILVAEKMAAMGSVFRRLPFPAESLREAWDQLLLAQHHDAWVCCVMGSGRKNWGWTVGARTWVTEEICDEVIPAAAEAMAKCGGPIRRPARDEQWVRVFNTLGAARHDAADLPLTTDPGTKSVRVFDQNGREVLAQAVPTRKYFDGSLNAAHLIFQAKVPSLGYSTYRVEAVRKAATKMSSKKGAFARQEKSGNLRIETDLYRIRMDPMRGGAITSFYAKDLRREFVDKKNPRLFNEYRGHFLPKKQWHSSADGPAKVEIAENGPLRVKVVVSGRIGPHPFHGTIAVTQGQRRIDFHAAFHFQDGTLIGDPLQLKSPHHTDRRQSYHDDHWKLRAFFPANLGGKETLYKNAAYDVCRSKNEDTFYTSWDTIKSNIILNWVDVVGRDEKHGLALFSDHTTSYGHGPNEPLSLILAWGGTGWWSPQYLKGLQELHYSLVPHAGPWDKAALSLESARWSEPLLTQLTTGRPRKDASAASLLSISGRGIETPTIMVERGDLIVRLFNAEGNGARRTISIASRPSGVQLEELDGRVIEQLAIKSQRDGRHSVRLAIPRFGIRTLRFRGVLERV